MVGYDTFSRPTCLQSDVLYYRARENRVPYSDGGGGKCQQNKALPSLEEAFIEPEALSLIKDTTVLKCLQDPARKNRTGWVLRFCIASRGALKVRLKKNLINTSIYKKVKKKKTPRPKSPPPPLSDRPMVKLGSKKLVKEIIAYTLHNDNIHILIHSTPPFAQASNAPPLRPHPTPTPSPPLLLYPSYPAFIPLTLFSPLLCNRFIPRNLLLPPTVPFLLLKNITKVTYLQRELRTPNAISEAKIV